MTGRRELRYLPNVLSASRLVLAAWFVFGGTTARVILVFVAAVTDFLDGFIARRARVTTRWGALIDPIADRVFMLAAVATFLFSGVLSTWGYFVLILRDLMTAIGFLVARVIPWLRPVQFKARRAGKIVTVLQLLTLVALLLDPQVVTPLLILVGVVSVLATIDYTLALWRARAQ